jgi:glycosyltransferase involved in cell wall biosynthesis
MPAATFAKDRSMPDHQPAVSVVIIFLNPSAAFLEEAIASVRAQTLQDWELLLVDDGSTDDSSALARAAAAADPERIQYLEHPGHANCGMSASRNRGIAAARGRYLALLDADDVYLPERLEHHVQILERHPDVAMVYGPTLYWHSWSSDAVQEDVVGRLGFALDVAHPPPTVLRHFMSESGIVPGVCSLTIRREKVLAVNGFEEAFRGCYEDQAFLSKICAQESVMLTDRCLDYYRQHAASCCAQAQDSGEYSEHLPHPARERFLRWLVGYLAEQGVHDPALERLLARDLWPYEHPRLYRWFVMPLLVSKLRLRYWIKQTRRRIEGRPPLPELAIRT